MATSLTTIQQQQMYQATLRRAALVREHLIENDRLRLRESTEKMTHLERLAHYRQVFSELDFAAESGRIDRRGRIRLEALRREIRFFDKLDRLN